ncbi:hypothetical protein E2562_033013 [Oryza meyeriana var. granulata]|uniref:Uncharacterized protein n=1 Tax=Oryza meyeriana var. granulata TaxID=110450 RepID=A0A6G1CWF6_9ORYZ|nr:hypothetical protein E2562_033013 [Oryza meyeriana var. granulata]
MEKTLEAYVVFCPRLNCDLPGFHAAITATAPALCSYVAVTTAATWIEDVMLQRGNVKMLAEHSSEYHQQF